MSKRSRFSRKIYVAFIFLAVAAALVAYQNCSTDIGLTSIIPDPTVNTNCNDSSNSVTIGFENFHIGDSRLMNEIESGDSFVPYCKRVIPVQDERYDICIALSLDNASDVGTLNIDDTSMGINFAGLESESYELEMYIEITSQDGQTKKSDVEIISFENSCPAITTTTTTTTPPLCARVNIDKSLNETCLHAAARDGMLNVVIAQIEEGVSVDVRDGYARTPLMQASRSSHTDIVRYLLDQGARADAVDQNNDSPLHYMAASSSSHSSVLSVATMLVEGGAYLNQQDGQSHTPLDDIMVSGRDGLGGTGEYLHSKGAECGTGGEISDYCRSRFPGSQVGNDCPQSHPISGTCGSQGTADSGCLNMNHDENHTRCDSSRQPNGQWCCKSSERK